MWDGMQWVVTMDGEARRTRLFACRLRCLAMDTLYANFLPKESLILFCETPPARLRPFFGSVSLPSSLTGGVEEGAPGVGEGDVFFFAASRSLASSSSSSARLRFSRIRASSWSGSVSVSGAGEGSGTVETVGETEPPASLAVDTADGADTTRRPELTGLESSSFCRLFLSSGSADSVPRSLAADFAGVKRERRVEEPDRFKDDELRGWLPSSSSESESFASSASK